MDGNFFKGGSLKTALTVLALLCIFAMSAAVILLAKKKKKQAVRILLPAFAGLILAISGWQSLYQEETASQPPAQLAEIIAEAGEYSGSAAVEVNHNVPFFTAEDLSRQPFAEYSDLDELGRCGSAMGMISVDMMPKEPRGEIDSIRPSGYHNAVYEDLIEDGFLYNRCHLIGYQLTGENANEKNLITGTRYMNTEGMEPYENLTASYIRTSKNPVLIRVTPVFYGDELVCRGVLMEAYSPKDSGVGICFCVYCYNVQPGIVISYQDGSSKRAAQ